MAQRTQSYAIVIPLANEAKTLNRFTLVLFAALEKLLGRYTVYFVIDNASKDNTLTLARNLSRQYHNLKIVYAPRNRHVVDAYLAGFDKALKDKHQFLIEMDSGFSHQPSEIKYFVEKLKRGYDCVFGVRPLWSVSYSVPVMRRFYSLVGTVLSNLFLKTQLSDMTSGFEGFNALAIKKILNTPLLSTGHFYQTEIRLRANRLGLKTATVPITYRFPSKSVNWRSLRNALTTFAHYLTH